MFGQNSASAGGAIESTKFQYPSTRETPISEVQNSERLTVDAAAWKLFGVWALGFGVSHSTNESPVRNERPVNKQSATNEIFLRHRTPVAAVETVVAVVAHRIIAVLWNLKCFRRIREVLLAWTVAAVSALGIHHPVKTISLRRLTVHIKKRRLDPYRVVR